MDCMQLFSTTLNKFNTEISKSLKSPLCDSRQNSHQNFQKYLLIKFILTFLSLHRWKWSHVIVRYLNILTDLYVYEQRNHLLLFSSSSCFSSTVADNYLAWCQGHWVHSVSNFDLDCDVIGIVAHWPYSLPHSQLRIKPSHPYRLLPPSVFCKPADWKRNWMKEKAKEKKVGHRWEQTYLLIKWNFHPRLIELFRFEWKKKEGSNSSAGNGGVPDLTENNTLKTFGFWGHFIITSSLQYNSIIVRCSQEKYQA